MVEPGGSPYQARALVDRHRKEREREAQQSRRRRSGSGGAIGGAVTLTAGSPADKPQVNPAKARPLPPKLGRVRPGVQQSAN